MGQAGRLRSSTSAPRSPPTCTSGRRRLASGGPRSQRGAWTADELVERLRAQGTRYHNLHPFHVRMDAGELTREELQRWVANRFYYQRVHPAEGRGDPLQLPRDRGAPRVDHADHRPRRHAAGHGRDRVVAAARRGARRRARRARVRAARAPGGALRRRRLRELRAAAAVDRGGRVVADRAVRPERDPRAPRGARGALPVDRSGRAPVLPRPARAGAARRRLRARAGRRALRARASSRSAPSPRCKFKTEMLWAQLEAIERGDTQPPAAP